MSVSSVDVNALSKFEYISVLIDFLKDPTKYTQLVADAKDATASYQKAVSDLTQAQSLSDYSAQIDAKYEKAQADLKTQQDSLTAQVSKADEDAVSREEVLNKKQQDLNTQASFLQDKANALDAQARSQSNLAATLNAKQVEVDSKLADLAIREQNLQDKAARVQALFG